MAEEETTKPEKTDPKSGSHKKPGTMTGIITRLLDGQDKDKDRDERITTQTIEALQGTNKMLVRVIIALIGVLGMLVSGVIGVSVTGTIPGYGDIEFSPETKKGKKGKKAKAKADTGPPAAKE